MNIFFYRRILSLVSTLLIVFSLDISALVGNALSPTTRFSYDCGQWSGEKCGTYTGPLSNKKPSGKGSLSFIYGGTYSGNFKKGYPNGSGTYTYANGKEVSGTFSWTDGISFVMEGPKSGTKPHYGGTDLVYVGMLLDGQPCGFGTVNFLDGGTFYGEFRDGTVKGKGVYVYREPNGSDYVSGSKWEMAHRISSDLGGRWYSGLVLDGKWQGYGMLCYNYSYYIGEVLDQYCSGHGTYWGWEAKGDPSGKLTREKYGHYEDGGLDYKCSHSSKSGTGSTSDTILGGAGSSDNPSNSGSGSTSKGKTCSTCRGKGFCFNCLGNGTLYNKGQRGIVNVTCSACGGSGRCSICFGSGVMQY